MPHISSQTPAPSTSQANVIVELSMRRDLAKRMGGIWIQKAAAEFVHARTVKDTGNLAAAKDLERWGTSYQQRAMDCWSAVAQFNRLLLAMKVPPLVQMNAGTHPDYVCSTEKGVKVSEQVQSTIRDIEHSLRPFDSP